MLSSFLFLAGLGLLAAGAWVPWWMVASLVGRNSAHHRPIRPTLG